ncbi:TPA: plasmid recombination protein [Escherichia coli]
MKGGVLMGRVSMPQGKGSQLHNRREYEKIGRPIPDNIDVSKSSENITLVDKDIREAYREIFGEALEKYNGKQKRADRKIEDYCDHIKKSKNGEKLFYEDVVQWGKKEDFQNPETRERAKEALVKYVEGFEERNPNLKLIGAYIHMDEASPHLHLDYVPVATGYSRGLDTRNSLDKAMKQMGHIPENESRKNNATKLWKENERAVFGQICRGLGLEVEPERKSERKSLTVDEYKEARDEMIGEIEQEKEAIVAEVEPLRELKTGIDEIDSTGTKLPFGYVAVKKKDLDEVKEQAKAYTANRDEIGELRERSAAVSQREQRADRREQQLDNKANELARQQQQLQQLYQRQLNLNQLLEKSERDGRAKDKKIADLQTENGTLRGQIRSLTAQLDQIKGELWGMINDLREKLRGAYESLTNVVKATGMLKYDREKDANGNYTYGKYGISNLSKAQEKLIDGLAEYGAKWAREDGFPEMAEEMEKRVGISKGIEKIIEPSAPKRSHYHDGPEL